ncbi:MAG: hypothetical protein ACKOQ6_01895 [Bacteroidota bacterium]
MLLTFLIANTAIAADWPKVIQSDKGKIVIYQPTPEELNGDQLKARAAFSVTPIGATDPVFGALWTNAHISTDRVKRMVYLIDAKVTDIRISDNSTDSSKTAALKTIIENEVPNWDLAISLDALLASIEQNNPKQQSDIKTDAPDVIYRDHKSVLVVLDGDPKMAKLDNTDYNRIMNTPYFLIQDPKSSTYYLYGTKVWYSTNSLTGTWTLETKPSKDLKRVEDWLEDQAKQQGGNPDSAAPVVTTAPDIIVRTKPTELIQTDGEAQFTTIDGTQLLYVKNTDNDLFRSITDQKYYILLSGRWFNSGSLDGPWNYIASDKLPSDFAKIPEGSEKDNVLASVAGTDAAREALMDAQVPQTAAVKRSEAKCDVSYDGTPQFQKIDGTSLSYGVNTSASVIKDGYTYYVCQSGIWFTGSTPNGPWSVASTVPADIQNIPSSNPLHNTKYVYIYDSTPDVVYVGYTPGYTGCYVYGPTVVYGTGYYYSGWYGVQYYPRPCTYGFAVHYNPWTGWGVSFGMGFGGYYGGPCGWYGPVYRPPYYYRPPYGGYYGPRGGYGNHYGNTNINVNNNININRSNNIYNNASGARPSFSGRPNNPGGNGGGIRPGGGGGNISRPDNSGGGLSRPGTGGGGINRPSGGDFKVPSDGGEMKNNVISDRSGNVFQNDGGNWKSMDNNAARAGGQMQNFDRSNLDRQQLGQDRGQMRTNNFNDFNRGGFGGCMGGRGGMGGGGMRR